MTPSLIYKTIRIFILDNSYSGLQVTHQRMCTLLHTAACAPLLRAFQASNSDVLTVDADLKHDDASCDQSELMSGSTQRGLQYWQGSSR
jgi:hypothetical protein